MIERVAQTCSDDTGPYQTRLLSVRPRLERANPTVLDKLKAALDGRGHVRRKVLCAELGVDDDSLRAAARHSGGEIAGGARGYFLVRQAPSAVTNRVVSGLLSRARELKTRAGEIVAVLNNRDRRAS